MKRRSTPAVGTALLLMLCCAASLEVLNLDAIRRHGLGDGDLEKMVYWTGGEQVFARDAEGFDSSRLAGTEASYRRRVAGNEYTQRVALKDHTEGFFHHRADTLIYIQFKAGELVLPFSLNNGRLVARSVVVDGKKYEYEEGEAVLLFSPRGPRE